MARYLMFAYGMTCYALFLATLFYAMGFTNNLVVPKSIDSGSSGPLAASILVNIGLLALFAVQHTVMARPAFKRVWTRIIPEPIERSTFVLATCCCFALLFWQWRPMPLVLWQAPLPWMRAMLMAVSLGGYALAVYSSFVIDHFELFGVRQVWRALTGRAAPRNGFVQRSLYKHVRHPLMTGFLIAFWATPVMTAGHLLFASVVTAYIVVGTTIEERDLVASLGDDYRRYCAHTPRFFPRRPLHRRWSMSQSG